MASSNEIAQIDEINKGLTNLNTTLSNTAEGYLRLVKTISDGNKSISESAITFDNLNKVQKETQENTKQLDALGKQLEASEAKLRQTEDERLKTIIQNRIATNEATKAIKDKIIAEQAAEGSLVRMRQQLSELTKAYDQSGTRTKEAAKQINDLSREIGKAEEATNRGQRSVGQYGKMWDELSGMLPVLGIAAIGAGIVSVFEKIKNSTHATADAFEFSMAGMRTGLDFFWQTLATGNWSNFTTKMNEAIQAGYEYAKTMDLVKDATRSLSMLEADMLQKNTQLEIDLRNKNLSPEQRKKAGEERIKNEEILVKDRTFIADKAFEGERKEMIRQTGLNEEKLIQVAKDIKSQKKLDADAYNEKADSYKKLRDLNIAQVGGGMSGGGSTIQLPDSPKMILLKKEMDLTDQSTKEYAKLLKDYDIATEESQQKFTSAYVKKKEAENSGLENTKKVYRSLNSAIKEISEEEDKANTKRKKEAEDAIKAKLDSIEADNNKELSIIKKRHIDSKNSEEQYHADMLAQEVTFLNNQALAYQEGMKKFVKGSKEYEDQSKKYQETQMKLQDIQVNSNLKTKELLLKTDKELADLQAENIQDKIKRETSIENQRFEDLKTSKTKELIVKENLSADEIKINDNIHKAIGEAAKVHQVKLNDITLKGIEEDIKNKHLGYAEQLSLLSDEYSKGLISAQQYADKKKVIEDESNKSLVEFRKKYGVVSEQSYADELKLFRDSENYKLLTVEEKLKAEKLLKDKYHKAEREAEVKLATDAVNAVFSLQKMKSDKQIADLEEQKNVELSNANLTAAQKANINAEYAKKEAAIKTKQAQNDKLKSLFDIAISTAVASMKTLASTPLPGGLALLLATIAMGAIQTGLVLAQPIPKFSKGTNSAPGAGIFGEAGRELMFLRDGDVALADAPTYFEGSRFKGAQIFSNPETEKMIALSGVGGKSGHNADDKIAKGLSDLGKGISSVEKAIKNKPVAIYDKDHRQIGIATSNSQTIYINRLIRKQ